LAPVSDRDRERDLLLGTVHALDIRPSASQDVATLLGDLLRFEVCQLPVSGDSELDRELTADLVLISAQTANWFATTSTTPDEKVAGLQLHHFGAFYKESWRVNDWIWGRLDAVTRLLTALLSTDRLRQLFLTTADIRRALAGAGADASPADVDAALRRVVPERLLAEVEAELELYEREGSMEEARTLERLTATADAFAYQLHEQIIAEELKRLAAAIEVDMENGTSANTNGFRFLGEYRRLSEAELNDPRKLLDLFDRARVGAERIADEYATDQFARTASTAAADLVGAADDESAGLGRLKTVTRPVRG
jgi:hypothetical protein